MYFPADMPSQKYTCNLTCSLYLLEMCCFLWFSWFSVSVLFVSGVDLFFYYLCLALTEEPLFLVPYQAPCHRAFGFPRAVDFHRVGFPE